MAILKNIYIAIYIAIKRWFGKKGKWYKNANSESWNFILTAEKKYCICWGGSWRGYACKRCKNIKGVYLLLLFRGGLGIFIPPRIVANACEALSAKHYTIYIFVYAHATKRQVCPFYWYPSIIFKLQYPLKISFALLIYRGSFASSMQILYLPNFFLCNIECRT